MNDIASIKAKVNLVDVIGKYLALKVSGVEKVAMCPFHDDHQASLKVNEKKQVWKCFACGKGGDAVDFLTAKGRSLAQAMEELNQMAGEVPARRHTADDWVAIPAGLYRVAPIVHYKLGTPATVWCYTDERKQCIGYICRFNFPDGHKETLPYSWCVNKVTGRKEWRWKGFAVPRPLYNLHLLSENPQSIVLVVEGEKTCDAAQALFPELICTTWTGGARSWKHTNWSSLKGRNVIFLPDKDEPGYDAMLAIAQLLMRDYGLKRARFVDVPDDKPSHWDIADEPGWGCEQAREFLRRHLYEIKDLKTLKR